MKVIKESEFAKEVSKGLVLVDFYAEWCGPCKMISPLLEQINNENDDIKIIKVDVDNSSNLASYYKVSSIPTLALFKDGKYIKRITGFSPKNKIEKFIYTSK